METRAVDMEGAGSRRRRPWGLAGLALGLSLLAAGCGAPAAEPSGSEAPQPKNPATAEGPVPASGEQGAQEQPAYERRPVKIAVADKSLAFLPFFFAKEKGIYDKYGLDAEILISKPSTVIAALLGKEIDVAATAGSVLRAAATADAPIRVIDFVMNETDFTLMGAPKHNRVEDLRGGLVASTSPTATTTVSAKEVIAAAGLDPEKDVTFLFVEGGATRYAALTAGRVDATMLSADEAEKAAREGFKSLAWFPEVSPGRPFVGLGVHQDAIRDDRGFLERLVRATRQAADALLADREGAVAFIGGFSEVDRSLAESLYDNHLVKTVNRTGYPDPQGLRRELASIAQQSEKPIGEVPIEKVFDASLLDGLKR